MSESKDTELRKVVLALIKIIEDKTRPENCYVNEWFVHEEWEDLKTQATELVEQKDQTNV